MSYGFTDPPPPHTHPGLMHADAPSLTFWVTLKPLPWCLVPSGIILTKCGLTGGLVHLYLPQGCGVGGTGVLHHSRGYSDIRCFHDLSSSSQRNYEIDGILTTIPSRVVYEETEAERVK